MNIRIYNARILSMTAGTGIIEGELRICGERITYVGEAYHDDDKSVVWDREIDADGNIVMPGFKDAHTHSAMTFLRSYADDLPLMEWLTNKVFPMEAMLTPEDIYHLTKLAILEYISGGITAAFDMYLTPDSIAEAARDCGFRMVMTGSLNNFSQSLDEIEHWYNKYNEAGSLISFQLGFHAEYTNSLENMEGIAALAAKYKAPVYMHNSETRGETDDCLKRHGMTPTALFEKLGIFDYGGGGYHDVFVTDSDLDIFREHGVSLITNPGSNVKLASGIAPISTAIDKGINIAIGTDGPASNNCLDMFREMFLTTGLAKLREHDAAAVPGDKVLAMAVTGGANAMCLPECDTLLPGKYADLIILDIHQPNMQPINNIACNIVYSGNKENVIMTIVNGRILYENGRFNIGEEPEAVYDKANEIISRMRSERNHE